MTQEKQYLLRLSWPRRALFQNWRGHWSESSAARAAQRQEAWAVAKLHSIISDPAAHIDVTFHPSPRSRADLHNMPATVKGAIDGIADAMELGDDRRFAVRYNTEVWGKRVKGGCVLFHVFCGNG